MTEERIWHIKVVSGIVLGIIVCAAMFHLLSLFKEMDEYEETNTYKIASLETTDGVKGHWSLFSGNIETVGYYWFYKINKDGSKSLMKIEAEQTKIYEDEDKAPYVEELKGYMYVKEYRLHIPKNPIEKKYDPHITKQNE